MTFEHNNIDIQKENNPLSHIKIVHVVGAPGAGKDFLLDKIKGEGVAVYSMGTIIKEYLDSLTESPVDRDKMYSTPQMARETVSGACHYFRNVIAHKIPPGTTVFLSMHYVEPGGIIKTVPEPNKTDIYKGKYVEAVFFDEIYSSLLRPTAVVVVTASPEEIARRLEARRMTTGRVPKSSSPAYESDIELQRSHAVCDRTTNVPLLVLDNTSSNDTNIQTLTDRLIHIRN